jgi:MFS transporter, FSR family, fosmidomycin resistance protein
MAVSETAAASTAPAKGAGEKRRALGVGCGAHALHDGYTDVIYVVLPLWQAEFGLPYAAVGLLRSAYTGTMAALQIPATLLARRIGAPVVLAGGTALTGFCFCLAGLSVGFPWLVTALLIGGLGAAAQHPIGSALVARAFEGARAITAIGTYNFAGDVGKMALPALAAALLLLMSWRPALMVVGLIGFAAALAILALMPRFGPEPPPQPDADRPAGNEAAAPASTDGLRTGFKLLWSVAALDSITRAGFMVFLPFLLIGKGASVATAGFALTLLFVGGALGKLACAHIGARFGIIGALVITEVLTGAGMLAVLALPLAPTLVLLPLVGVVLNGTSSLTYGSVPQFIAPGTRERAFGIFYTGTLGAGAVSPTVCGLLGDLVGLPSAVIVVAGLTLATIPLALALRRHMGAGQARQ